jgi:hypothetical protein
MLAHNGGVFIVPWLLFLSGIPQDTFLKPMPVLCLCVLLFVLLHCILGARIQSVSGLGWSVIRREESAD